MMLQSLATIMIKHKSKWLVPGQPKYHWFLLLLGIRLTYWIEWICLDARNGIQMTKLLLRKHSLNLQMSLQIMTWILAVCL